MFWFFLHSEIPCVVIQSRISQFWRHQHGSPRWFLATIEAVHQFLVELHIACQLGFRCDPESVECQARSIPLLTSPSKGHESLKPESLSAPSSSDEVKNSAKLESLNNSVEKSCSKQTLHPDKQPSKFVKNLALCRGIRSDPGGDPGITLCGPDQWIGKYNGDYDNLLFFFQFMYYKIHSLYDHDQLRSYQRDIV